MNLVDAAHLSDVVEKKKKFLKPEKLGKLLGSREEDTKTPTRSHSEIRKAMYGSKE